MTNRSLDWTRMIEVLEQAFIENLVMRDILTNRVVNFDWNELENGVLEMQRQGEIHQKFDVLYRAARGDADFHNAIQGFLKPNSRAKPS